MKQSTLHTLLAGLTMLMVSSASAAVILHGPADYSAVTGSLTPVDTIAASELTGVVDQVVISYTVNNVAGANVNDSWVGLTINDYTAPAVWDITGGLAGFTTRTYTGANNSHRLHTDVTSDHYVAAQEFTGPGQAHAVRITLSGFSDGNGFNGVRSALFEIDELSSTFNSADKTMTRNVDFGTTDEMKLRLQNHNIGLDVDGFTVVIPEPATLGLVAMTGVGLIAARRFLLM